jgi:hypothetical protein
MALCLKQLVPIAATTSAWSESRGEQHKWYWVNN